METKANFVAIGLFTLILTAIGFGIVFWIARYDESTPMKDMEVRFEGSVAGLIEGGSVLFNGIKVGDVKKLAYDPDSPKHIKALLHVDANIPLKQDSRIELSYKGLTGVGTVEIKGGSSSLPDLLDQDGIPSLDASSSSFEDLMQGARQVLARADSVLSKVEKVVDANETRISTTLENVETFTTALKDNSGNIDTFLADASNAAKGLGSLSARLETLSDRADGLLAAVDPESIRTSVSNVEKFSNKLVVASEKVETIVANVDPQSVRNSLTNVEKFSQKLASASDRFDGIMAEASDAAKGINKFSQNMSTSLAKVDKIVESVDPQSIEASVSNVETFSEKLASASDRFEDIMVDASGAAKGLNQFTGDLGTSLAKVDTLIESVDPQAVKNAVASLGSFATSLDESSDDIDAILADAKVASGSISTFSQTLSARTQDFNQIVTDAQELAGRLNEASKRVDTILVKVDGILSDEEGGKGLVEEVTLAARSIRKVSEKFETRADEIANGLARFSGRGLREVEGMVSDARRTIKRLEGAVEKLESDPSSLIFGSSNKVKTYNRRY